MQSERIINVEMTPYRYKSWSDLNKRLQDLLCDSFKGRLTYFLTRYHRVHNSYGRASIRLDGMELAVFDWPEITKQETDLHDLWKQTGKWLPDDKELNEKWNSDCTLSDYDFVNAAVEFLQMNITDALKSEKLLIRVLAVLDRRVGKRTLDKIKSEGEYLGYPAWARQFFELRIGQTEC